MNTKTIVKFDPMQIEAIIDRVVPMVAAPEDEGFFRGILTIKAQESSSAQFSAFIANLLKCSREA